MSSQPLPESLEANWGLLSDEEKSLSMMLLVTIAPLNFQLCITFALFP
jgi:hypothetical protein